MVCNPTATALTQAVFQRSRVPDEPTAGGANPPGDYGMSTKIALVTALVRVPEPGKRIRQ